MSMSSIRPNPAVEHHTEAETTTLRFKGENLKINTAYFHKLVRNIQIYNVCVCIVVSRVSEL